ncbi:dihydrolipoamide dehydrogenase, partial [mine drainage metagenome]
MAGTYARATEVLVVGAGPAGYMAALRLGQLGKKVLLVERQELGGECLNRGCIPSKALIHASRLYAQVTQEGAEIGVSATGVGFDMAQTQRWKTEVVAKERRGGPDAARRGRGSRSSKGVARFTGPRSAQFTAPDGGSERIDFTDAV